MVACLMVTNVWSDWRNGRFWWIRSVDVAPAWREPGTCGSRLDVEKDNALAQRTDSALGMTPTDYLVCEEFKRGLRYCEERRG